MRPRQIHHVDVVAYAGTVTGRVVAAEHLQPFAQAHRHLAYVRHQVVRDARGVLADQAGRMRAHRVEVAQVGGTEFRIRLAQVADQFLHHQLGPAVGIGHAQRRVLAHRDPRGIAVHRGRGTEHQPANAGAAHRLQQVDGAADVVFEVVERTFAGFADRLQRGEMDDRVITASREQGHHRFALAQVHGVADNRSPGDPMQPFEHLRRTVGEVVRNLHLVPALDQLNVGVGADVAGPPAQEDPQGLAL